MRLFMMTALATMALALAGCDALQEGTCVPHCRSQTQNSSSLVSFLYPDGKVMPPTDSIPELKVPLRVGLAFLPSQGYTNAPVTAAQKELLLQRIRERFTSRKFVSEIVIIPDYYLQNARGFEGLTGVQRHRPARRVVRGGVDAQNQIARADSVAHSFHP